MNNTISGLRRLILRLGVIAGLCALGWFALLGGQHWFGDKEEVTARYQFNKPPAEVARQLAGLASAPSRLGRIGVTRPALLARIEPGEDHTRVIIAAKDGHGIELTFVVTPLHDGDKSMVSLKVDTARLGEVSLDEKRFGGAAVIIEGLGDALGALANEGRNRKAFPKAEQRFGRLFDLAAVLADEQLITKVTRLGAQAGLVDFLFSDRPREPNFDESADYPQRPGSFD